MKATVLSALLGLSGLFIAGFAVLRTEEIPKVWDLEQLASMHLPFADTSVGLGFVSEAYYRGIPERISYQTYPFYMPGREPKGYYDSLAKLDPVIRFKAEELKTETDWIRAGERIYDLPQNFIPLDSAMRALLPTYAKKWQAAGILGNKQGIIPFVAISIRRQGQPELGFNSCGMCHTKQMPDDRLFKGAQGNFVGDRFINILTTASPAYEQATPEDRLRMFHQFNQRLYYAPWVRNEYQKNYQKLTPADLPTAYSGLLPGVQSRNNTSFDHPVSIPDLYWLKERKYLDKSGHNRQRSIADLMRYATLNQNLNSISSYGGFVPDPKPADPANYSRGRFGDAQLYALAKFLYSLRPPPNPVTYPAGLLAKGKTLFIEQGCVTCHTPPLYTNNKLTPVDGFTPPARHFALYDIFDVSVGTDPGLTLYTRRGSGYYKVPSLIGVWNRTAFLHDGHLASLEDLLDSARFSPDYTPTYFKPLGVTHMAVAGHDFGTRLSAADKKALVAFLKSL